MNEEVRGPAFPFRIDPLTGGVAWTSGRDKLRQNIRVILGTRLGERPMLRDFGTRLPALVHEPNGSALAELAEVQAREALLRWEPRILLTDSRAASDEGQLVVRLQYLFLEEAAPDRLSVPLT